MADCPLPASQLLQLFYPFGYRFWTPALNLDLLSAFYPRSAFSSPPFRFDLCALLRLLAIFNPYLVLLHHYLPASFLVLRLSLVVIFALSLRKPEK